MQTENDNAYTAIATTAWTKQQICTTAGSPAAMVIAVKRLTLGLNLRFDVGTRDTCGFDIDKNCGLQTHLF